MLLKLATYYILSHSAVCLVNPIFANLIMPLHYIIQLIFVLSVTIWFGHSNRCEYIVVIKTVDSQSTYLLNFKFITLFIRGLYAAFDNYFFEQKCS